MITIECLLKTVVKYGASDLFLSAGAAPSLKIEGKTRALGEQRFDAEQVKELGYSLLDDDGIAEFEEHLEYNLAVSIQDVGRFRVNLYRQRGSVALVARYISDRIPTIEALNLPPILKDLVMEPRGLVIVAGSTGSGKSTTLASMIDYRNERTTGHILTIEEPIEYVHTHKKSIVDQREIGLDTLTYANALKNVMREAPDVILIGEIRDAETMKSAVAYADTGHLCITTLHSNNASQTFDRIVNFFPESAHRQLYLDLSEHLRAIVSQRLVPTVDGRRVPAVELLIQTPYISDLILSRDIAGIKAAIRNGGHAGMQTFEQALLALYRQGRISHETALAHADSRTDLRLAIRSVQPQDADAAPDGLEIGKWNPETP
jgi:twitching motility protein PilU